MSDYRVDVKVRNNNILRYMEQMGYRNVNHFCTVNKMSPQTVGALVNLKHPAMKHDRLTPTAQKLIDILKCTEQELWTEAQMYSELDSNIRSMELDEVEVMQLMRPTQEQVLLEHELEFAVHKVLETLTPREEKVISMRMGIGEYGPEKWTLAEIAADFECTVERIRQIETKTLRKLRHPSRSKHLKAFVVSPDLASRYDEDRLEEDKRIKEEQFQRMVEKTKREEEELAEKHKIRNAKLVEEGLLVHYAPNYGVVEEPMSSVEYATKYLPMDSRYLFRLRMLKWSDSDSKFDLIVLRNEHKKMFEEIGVYDEQP